MLNLLKLLNMFIIILFLSCSEHNIDNKKFMTTTLTWGVEVYPTPRRISPILTTIPFKSKIEIIDNKTINSDGYEVIKIKYNDYIGYVSKDNLSEKNEIPFIDNIKYNYRRNEFVFNKSNIIEYSKEALLHHVQKSSSNLDYYYFEDPQIFSFYGKNCKNEIVKRILIILRSKLNKKDDVNIFLNIYEENTFDVIQIHFRNYKNESELEKSIDHSDVEPCGEY